MTENNYDIYESLKFYKHFELINAIEQKKIVQIL